MTYKEINKLLIKNGWVLIRTKGSHYQYKHPDGRTVTVPNHGSKDISINVIKNIESGKGLSLKR